MGISQFIGQLVPGLCPLCRETGGGSPVCGDCVAELNRSRVRRTDPPEGIDRIASSFEHEGVARDLLVTFKFRSRTGLADLIAGYMADAIDWPSHDPLLVPVPPAPLRTWLRGFDPVGLLSESISGELRVPLTPEQVLQRRGLGRQRGRARQVRIGQPPDIRPVESAARWIGGREVILIDDVSTTGATLSASAAALRIGGAASVSAVTLTRRS